MEPNSIFFSHSKHSLYVPDFQCKCITVNLHKTQNYFLWYSTAVWYTTDVIHRCLVINNQHSTLTMNSSVHRNKLYTVPSFCKLNKNWLTLLYIMWLCYTLYTLYCYMILVDICSKDVDSFCITKAPHLLAACSSKLGTSVVR